LAEKANKNRGRAGLAYYLPTKIVAYLTRLKAEYSAGENALELEIISNCRVRFIEETEMSDWNGGSVGHDVRLYVPLTLLVKIGLKNQERLSERICDDLNLLSRPVQNEWFRVVQLEQEDETDIDYQSAIPLPGRPPVDPDTVPFWTQGLVRLFISHRDEHKAKAKALATELDQYGITSFVAHDTIQPMSEWRKEILKGLETMEIMLVFLTDDFEASTWTNQEVGFALGANKPIVSLKLGRKDPPGFISHAQALKGDVDKPKELAGLLYPLLAKTLGAKSRLDNGLIAAFINSQNFIETRDRFDRLSLLVDKLDEEQLLVISKGFYSNSQLSNCAYLSYGGNRFKRYLEQATGKSLIFQNGKIYEPGPIAQDDEIPF
jgi:TIR domain